mmetsp:Transcript_17894/g.69353  ORF Transcript_17894/g.69353 Transcript_17894/m.69353 type:complete len:662 (+) Transcript_17894:66-2051(+)
MAACILLARARNQTLAFTKAVRFEESTTVLEAMRIIADKCSIIQADISAHWILYVPPKSGVQGKYLRDLKSSVLACADFKDRDEIELREVASVIHIVNRCGDDDSKQEQVDLELTGAELLAAICAHYKYPNQREYELHTHKVSAQAPTKRRNLSLSKALAEQGLREGAVLHIRRKQRSRQLKFSTSQRSRKNLKRQVSSGQSNLDVSEPMFVKHTRDDYNLGKQEAPAGADELFGYDIASGLRRDNEPSYAVTPLIVAAMKYIEANAMDLEGIFRLSGKAWQVDKLRSQLNNTSIDPDFSGVTDPHLVCAVLKQYLRELPEPVVPFRYYEEFLEVARNADAKDDVILAGVTPLLQLLERPNFLLLRRLMLFLKRVSGHANKNKMGIRNLATIFGPNILRQEDQSDMMAMVRDSGYITSLTMALISHAESLFAKPELPSKELRKRQPPQAKAGRSKASPGLILAANEEPLVARALYDFTAQCDDQVSLKRGDKVKICKILENGWCYGSVGDHEGFFPKHYCTDPHVVVPGQAPPTVLLSPREPVSALRSPKPSPMVHRRGADRIDSLHKMLQRKKKHQSQVFQTMEDAQRKVVLQQLEIDRLRSDLEKAKLELVEERQARKMFETQALIHVDNFTKSMLTIAESAMATRAASQHPSSLSSSS